MAGQWRAGERPGASSFEWHCDASLRLGNANRERRRAASGWRVCSTCPRGGHNLESKWPALIQSRSKGSGCVCGRQSLSRMTRRPQLYSRSKFEPDHSMSKFSLCLTSGANGSPDTHHQVRGGFVATRLAEREGQGSIPSGAKRRVILD